MPLPEQTSSNNEPSIDSADDVLDLLNDKPEESSDASETKEPDNKEEELEIEEPEENDEESKADEAGEEELDLVVPAGKKEILAKYPNIFKEFPSLEKSFYREQAFTEVFPTVNDAKNAAETVKNFNNFQDGILSGNLTGVLKSVKETDQKAYEQIIDNYLPNLRETDQTAFLHVIGSVINESIRSAIGAAQQLNQKNPDAARNLDAAARIMNHYIFGTDQIQGQPNRFAKEESKPDPERQKLEQEKVEFLNDRLQAAMESVSTRADNSLKYTIEQNIDPRGAMSEYVKQNAIRDCMNKLEELIASDTRFKAVNDKLWEKAIQDGFTKNSMDRIRGTYLSKAKTLLPDILKSVRNKALSGGAQKGNNSEAKSKKGPLPVGQSATQPKSGKIDRLPKGMKVEDFFAMD